ncbi:MAG: hypothetical protein ACJ77M_05605 [Thermoleophilaceae bacterium]|jgi:hypothetical protein
MSQREAVLGAVLLFIAFLTFLTVRAIVRGTDTGLAVVSLVVLLLLGFGVLGAITSPPDE